MDVAVTSSRPKRNKGGEGDLLAAEQQSAAAFQALAGVRSQSQIGIDLNAIAGAGDETLPFSKGKGDSVSRGRSSGNGSRGADAASSSKRARSSGSRAPTLRARRPR